MLSKKEILIGTLTGVLGNVVYAVIATLGRNNGSLVGFKAVICASIPLWYILLALVIACGVVVCMHYRRKNKLAFLQQTSQMEQGIEFQWVWVKNEESGKYEMEDFWPICPTCHKQMRVDLYDRIGHYHCSDNHIFDLTTILNIKRDLLHNLKREFKEYADYISYPKM